MRRLHSIRAIPKQAEHVGQHIDEKIHQIVGCGKPGQLTGVFRFRNNEGENVLEQGSAILGRKRQFLNGTATDQTTGHMQQFMDGCIDMPEDDYTENG